MKPKSSVDISVEIADYFGETPDELAFVGSLND